MLFLEPRVTRERRCSAAGGGASGHRPGPSAPCGDTSPLIGPQQPSTQPTSTAPGPIHGCRRPPFLCALWDGAMLFVILPVTMPLTSHEGLYRILPSHLRETGPRSAHKFFSCPQAYGLRAQGPGLNTWLVSLELLSYHPPTPAWCPGWIFTVFCGSRI